MIIKYYYSNSTNPYANLAIEEVLFDSKKNDEIIIYLWQNDRTVVIGRYQNIFEEVNLDYASSHGIKVVRRLTGGGAVYHDLGNLNYSFIVDEHNDSIDYCRSILEKVLLKYDIVLEKQGRNDLIVNGAKVSGTAKHIEKGKILYHGTLLIKSDLSVLQKVLTRNNKISNSVSKKSVERRVANLSDIIGQNMSVEDIISDFSQELNMQPIHLYEDNDKIVELVNKRYGTTMWNYGFQGSYDYSNKRRFNGGTVAVYVNIKMGIIEDIHFSGDFISEQDVSELEKKIKGLKLDTEMRNALKTICADKYIKGVTCEDMYSLFEEVCMK